METILRPVAIIPTYNNEKTIADMINETKKYLSDIVVINDGSTDSTPEIIKNISGIHVINFPKNRGKGAGLQAGFAYSIGKGYTHAITIDADGQHLAEDIPLFLQKIKEEPGTLWIGDRILPVDNDAGQPPRSRFGRKFGAFWYRFYTGTHIRDTQSGFRAYPLMMIDALECSSPRYEFEIEILIAAAWSEIPVKSIPIHLLYHPKEERVSHFRPVRDFIRISKVNSKAAIAKIFLPKYVLKVKGLSIRSKLKTFIFTELKAHTTPMRASVSLGAGVCMAITPFHGIQVVSMLAIAYIFRLNRPLSLLGITVSSPPLIPFWLIAGLGTGKVCVPQKWADGFVAIFRSQEWAVPAIESMKMVLPESLSTGQFALDNLATGFVQWFFGSLVLAIICGCITIILAYPFFKKLNLQKT